MEFSIAEIVRSGRTLVTMAELAQKVIAAESHANQQQGSNHPKTDDAPQHNFPTANRLRNDRVNGSIFEIIRQTKSAYKQCKYQNKKIGRC